MTQPVVQKTISRKELAKLLNEDLAREYQAIIAYVVYSQVLKGAEYMSIADQLQIHAAEELKHALIISRQIDYLGEMPTVTPKPVKTSEDAREMLRFDLDNENETIRHYRDRRSWSTSRTTKLISPRRWVKTFPILPDISSDHV